MPKHTGKTPHTRKRQADRSAPTPPKNPRPLIVGIGASAGGLEAFKTFLHHMPADSGMAFVLVQHLAPNHHSMLVELLVEHTAMPIDEAADGAKVKANHVYVIPPGTILTIEAARLRVEKSGPVRPERRQIDTFFSSLAADQGEYAVCIVLSGSGSDGTAGLKSVKEYGGFAMAQAGLDASVGSSMPASAAATGLVDYCVPIEQMPAKLTEYARHLGQVAPHKDADGNRRDVIDYLEPITGILQNGLGHDFSRYKQNTLVRRVQRRMQVLQEADMQQYVERLRSDPDEQRRLFNDLLIGVTQFFRDPEAWQALEKTVLPPLLERDADQPIRVWSAGCGAGDEVYTLAIVFAEALAGSEGKREVQIFGTDIDERAIEIARAGRYASPPPGLSDERRKRYFVHDEDGTWCPDKSIREMCVFAPHSVIRDPPFSRLDLITCRNLLIYMDGELQDRVLGRLHYGLKPDGWLFLGSAEGISGHENLFKVVDKQHRLFQRSENGAGIPDFAPSPAPQPLRSGEPRERARHATDRIERAARRVIEKHAMPYVVVDADRQIVRFSGGPLSHFVNAAPGEARFDLFAMLKRPLREAARAALSDAFSNGEAVVTENLPLRIDGRAGAVTLVVEPFDTSGYDGGGTARLVVLAFREVPPGATAGEPGSADGRGKDLEHELQVTKAQLNTAIRDLETSNEDMRSANEEYQSVNEELQSTNEELETSKEEMQSVNEELQTVNTELGHKNDELAKANSDLRNLLDSTRIATLFLDSRLNVKGFTPGVRELFHLRDGDVGRPVTEIVSRLDYAALERDARKVLQDLDMLEREVELDDGERQAYIMRIRPYRTVEDVINGVVITFTDITARKRDEEALRQSEARLSAFVTASSDVVYRMSPDWTEMRQLASDRFLAETRVTSTHWVDEYIPPDDRARVQQAIDAAIAQKKLFELEHRVFRSDGSIGWTFSRAVPLLDDAGEIVEWFGTATDIGERKRSEAHRELLMHELSHRVKNTLATVQAMLVQTQATTTTAEEFSASFAARLRGFAEAHGLLTRSDWRGVDLAELLQAELLPYGDPAHPQWAIEGEPVQLASNKALALGMAFHELATNAVKHGALSTPTGHIGIDWTIEGTDTGKILHFDWTERGGPRVEAPKKSGFGTQLLKDGLPYELDANVTLEFAAAGVHCHIDLPLKRDGAAPRET